MTSRQIRLSPGEVVARAYRAANRGRFTDANRYVSRGVLRSMQASRRVLRTSRKSLAASLATIRDGKQRAQITGILEMTSHFEDPNYCWKLSTHGRSIASLEVTRASVRGDTAVVTIRLQLADGTVVREREPLVRTRVGWRIGEGALQNKRMQLTRSALANGRRGPRS